ncbi:hypothetical protein [Frondihabitans peucedani]
MQPNAIQALIVLTDPLCVFTLDLVHDGVTSEAEIARRVAERLGVSERRSVSVLDGLAGIGYVSRTSLGRVEPRGPGHLGAVIDAALDQLDLLRAVGEEEHALDCVEAIDAAWNTRSDDPGRRVLGALFRSSPAGARFRARCAEHTLGQPWPGDASEVA